MRTASSLSAAMLLSIAMATPDAKAVALLVDEFDDGDLAVNNGIGSGFEAFAFTALPVVDENGSVAGAVQIDMQGDPNVTGLGGIRSLDTFTPTTTVGEFTRITWSVNSATTDPGIRHLLGFDDAGVVDRRVEVNLIGSTAATSPGEIVFLLKDGGAIVTGFSGPHNVDWSMAFDVVLEVGEAGYSVDWGFGSQSGSWPMGFDFATYAAGGNLHVNALANEGQGADTTPAVLVLDRVSLEVIPEPSTALLLALGLAGLARGRRRPH